MRRLDDGGIIQVPNAHVWVECECANPIKQRNLDSLSKFGPLSQVFILGEVHSVVWPFRRRGNLEMRILDAVVSQVRSG